MFYQSNFQFQVLTAEDAGLLEGDEEQEFTGQIKQQQIRWGVVTFVTFIWFF